MRRVGFPIEHVDARKAADDGGHSFELHPGLFKDDLIRQLEAEASKSPRNKVEFSRPIQMRFNELIAGVRAELAVKVFGDDFPSMLRAANQIAAILKEIEGAADIKVEEVQGLPAVEVRIDKAEIARCGLKLADVQNAEPRTKTNASLHPRSIFNSEAGR
ncbi:Cu/Ag efflux pump CusA [Bradyrhizobium japonicum]